LDIFGVAAAEVLKTLKAPVDRFWGNRRLVWAAACWITGLVTENRFDLSKQFIRINFL